jgi:hypothetical protein
MLRTTFHPELSPFQEPTGSQVATASVWGAERQATLSRLRVGIVGLGSVGSIVAEALSRVGISRLTLIDHDRIEERNLDRVLGSVPEDVESEVFKVEAAERQVRLSHTSPRIDIDAYQGTLLSPGGLGRVLDCDFLFSCVDRPAPRHLLNAVAYAHLIPVVDGGIYARVTDNRFVHADWRIHTVGPGRACMVCIGAVRREDIALDQQGLLDQPDYISGLEERLDPLLSRRNIFPFSLSVAAHQVIQFLGIATGEVRLGGRGPQMYHSYPGAMDIDVNEHCAEQCEYSALTATGADLRGNLTASDPNPD